MSIRVVTAPTAWLLTLTEGKAACRVDDTDSDVEIQALIQSAQRQVEAITQRRYSAQVLEWVRETWEDRMILPVAPGGDCSHIAVTSVKYADLQGVQQILDPATMYWARPSGPTLMVVRQWFAVWPWLGDAAERVVIRMTLTCDASVASDGAKLAAKLLVSHWFRNRDAVVGVDNRDSSTPLPFGVMDALFDEMW